MAIMFCFAINRRRAESTILYPPHPHKILFWINQPCKTLLRTRRKMKKVVSLCDGYQSFFW